MQVRTLEIKIYKNQDSKTEVYSFKYPDASMSFKINQIDSSRPDSCMVQIDGVSRATYGIFKLPDKSEYNNKYIIEIYHGINNNNELLYTGDISRVIYSFNAGKQTLKIIADKNIDKFTKNVLPISISGENKLIDILKYITGQFEYSLYVSEDVNTQEPVTRFGMTGSCEECLQSLLQKKYKYYVDSNAIYVYKDSKTEVYKAYIGSSVLNSNTKVSYIVHTNNGLLQYPSDDTEDNKYNLRTVILANIKVGDKILVPIDKYWYADYDTGNYKTFIVEKYNSVFQNGFGTTEMECVLDDSEND